MSDYLITCYGCEADFVWTEPELNEYGELAPIPAYHSKNCKERSRIAKVRQLKKFGVQPCPRSDKQKFSTYEEATEYANKKYQAKQGNRQNYRGKVYSIGVYRCQCGWLHLGRRVALPIIKGENK